MQRRIQRYGWDLAADEYERLWARQLDAARTGLLASAALAPGEAVLDVACGTGLVTRDAARAVGPGGRVVGVDLSGRMVGMAREEAVRASLPNVAFERMDAEALDLPAGRFDVALCALGLMYMPDPGRALMEMHRVLRPGGRVVASVWGERSRCGWSTIFPIVDAEVTSDVCPLFFLLGGREALAQLCKASRFEAVEQRRFSVTLEYANADEACRAALVGGPAALAWSRFDEPTRLRVRARYVESISRWRRDRGYALPGEFVVVSARTGTDAACEAERPL